MRRSAWAAMVAGALLCGCARDGGWVALPEQRPAPAGRDPVALAHLVWMSEARADSHIVRDIAKGSGAGWRRWANAAPELRFDLKAGRKWNVEAVLSVPDAVLKQTGPVRVTVRVNGREAGVEVFESGEERTIAMAAPEGLSGETRLELSPDKTYLSPADGAKLSFLLRAAGFRER